MLNISLKCSHIISLSLFRDLKTRAETTNLTSSPITQGNLLAPLSQGSMRHSKLLGKPTPSVDKSQSKNNSQGEENGHQSCCNSLTTKQREELLLNNNELETDTEPGQESQETEYPFEIVAEKDSQVFHKY